MDATAKQQIVERVKQASNILVTVSNNPTVDQLAACIGLTLLLNKMGKHATAVFSGKVPSTLEFLQPEKTIETNTNSLQDFIISLDKNKADKLRYKVEDQVVRIFITPYRTSLSEKDLVFSQGDFNVDAVMALGIKDRTQIDQAISIHGRILHDATVISVNAGQGTAPQLGQLNWQDAAASSLCEMLVSISEALGANLIDNQMATAFLTGIVAETARFSNAKTSPKVMTMSAQLMAAGANQQLIVSKLEPPVPAAPPPPKAPPKAPPPPPKDPNLKVQGILKKDGSLSVSHEKSKADGPEVEITPSEILIDKQGNLKVPDKPKPPVDLSATEPEITPLPSPVPVVPFAPMAEPLAPPEPEIKPVNQPPVADGHHALLDNSKSQGSMSSPFTADMQAEWIDPYSSVSIDPLSEKSDAHNGLFQRPEDQPVAQSAPTIPAPQQQTPALGVDNARDAVKNALASAPFDAGSIPPITSLNAEPVNLNLHDSAAGMPASGTPSLSLPTDTNGNVSASMPPPVPVNDLAPAAPPPVPPPLPLGSNPGAILPNNPTYQPPTS